MRVAVSVAITAVAVFQSFTVIEQPFLRIGRARLPTHGSITVTAAPRTRSISCSQAAQAAIRRDGSNQAATSPS